MERSAPQILQILGFLEPMLCRCGSEISAPKLQTRFQGGVSSLQPSQVHFQRSANAAKRLVVPDRILVLHWLPESKLMHPSVNWEELPQVIVPETRLSIIVKGLVPYDPLGESVFRCRRNRGAVPILGPCRRLWPIIYNGFKTHKTKSAPRCLLCRVPIKYTQGFCPGPQTSRVLGFGRSAKLLL